jgi:hypothetical protein
MGKGVRLRSVAPFLFSPCFLSLASFGRQGRRLRSCGLAGPGRSKKKARGGTMERSGHETKTPPRLQQIFENLIFLEKVFSDSEDEEISNLPFLELGRSFELRTGAQKTVATH